MSPEDFEALLKVLPDETVERYLNIAESELLNRRPTAVAVSSGAFVPQTWSSGILEKYKSKLTLANLPKMKF